MPEGDTILRTAEVLRSALGGRKVTAARAQPRPGLRVVPRMERIVGATVTTVEARGKNLLIGFDNGLTLRTHMRMRGSWHRYRPAEPWRRPAREATVVVETAESVAVCFGAPVAELLTDADLRRHRSLTALGPDLLADDFEADEALRRLRERATMQLGEALLDQRAVAGIGNVYKSETCFIERVDPWRTIEGLDDETLRRLLARARRLMQANLGGGARVTTGSDAGPATGAGVGQSTPGAGAGRRADPGAGAGLGAGGSLWVYGRAGRPCRRCGTRIEARRQGELARLTYWCPRCQS